MEAFQARCSWVRMVLTVLPVLPPDLRPLVPLDGVALVTLDQRFVSPSDQP